MRATRPVLSFLVALLLAMQSAMAAAHCLSMAASPGGAVICTPEGLRHAPLPGEPAGAEHAGDACFACPLLAPPVLPGPPQVSAPAWIGSVEPPSVRGAAVWLPPARAPPYAPRGPPFLV
ncbi:DUF2946 family protein [Muricoccus radiodurans]|uniref:DUF2946 family protein n=1 Tax=Muricoccus radiodurans TaxID=2231721 RepID=UPI003CFB39F2